MKKGFKVLSLVMSLVMILSVVMVSPFSVASAIPADPARSTELKADVTFDFALQGKADAKLNWNSKYSISCSSASLGATYNLKKYTAYEFDVYAESTGTEDVPFNISFSTGSNDSRVYFGVTVPVNQWVHKVLYMKNGSGGNGFSTFNHDGTAVTHVYFDGNWVPDPSTTVRIVNSTFVIPNPDYVHEPEVPLNLDFTTTAPTANGNTYRITANSQNLGATYDINNYFAFEFDVYITSPGTANAPFNFSFRLGGNDNTRCYVLGVSIPVNQWVHKVLYMDAFNNRTSVSTVYLDGGAIPDPNTTIRITNCAFVNAPAANYINTVAQPLNYMHKAKSTNTVNGSGKYNFNENDNKTDIGGPYNATNYSALEFDIFVESTGSTDTVFNFNFKNSSNGNRLYKNLSIPVNQWVHKILDISTFTKQGGAASGTDASKVYIDGSVVPDPDTTLRIVNIAFVNYPTANYVHEAAQTFNFKHIATSNNGSFSNSGTTNLGGTYNVTNYLAYEFDILAESPGTSDIFFTFNFQSNAGSYNRFAKTGLSIPVNQWIHKIIYITDFDYKQNDGTAITKLYLDGGSSPDGNTTVRIINSAFVRLPSASYTNNLALDLDANYDRIRSRATGGSFATVKTNFTRYDYVEFDFFQENVSTSKQVRIWFNNQTTNQKGFYDVTATPGASWTHYVVSVNDINCWYTWGTPGLYGDRTSLVSVNLTNDYVAEGEHYRIINLALTKSSLPGNWGLDLGDVNGDGVIDILDLVYMDTIFDTDDYTNYNSEIVDFDDSGSIDDADLTVMMKYLLDVLDALAIG